MRAIDTDGRVCYLQASEHGLLFTNQVGGYACHHPEIRAILIPLVQQHDEDTFQKAMDALFCADDSKYRGWCCHDGIDAEDADYIDAALRAIPDPQRRLSVELSRLKDCEEAWIWVVADDGTSGILTWENSD